MYKNGLLRFCQVISELRTLRTCGCNTIDIAFVITSVARGEVQV